jgi:hypothetical protein
MVMGSFLFVFLMAWMIPRFLRQRESLKNQPVENFCKKASDIFRNLDIVGALPKFIICMMLGVLGEKECMALGRGLFA